MSKWKVRLFGDGDDLEDLSKCLAGEGCSIEKEGEHYFLLANAFEDVEDDHGVVLGMAQELARVLTGAAYLALGTPQKIGVGEVRRREDDGSERVEKVFGTRQIIRSKVELDLRNDKGGTETLSPEAATREWVDFSLRNDDAKKVMRLHARDHDWVNLYRILEVVKVYVGGWRGHWERLSASKAEVDRFRRTAGSVGAVGDDARHGIENTDPPPKPMTIGEARELVARVVRNWLHLSAGANS